MARLAGRGWWGYTIAWEGWSRLNVRWGAVRPLSIECHPPAQATRFGTLGLALTSAPHHSQAWECVFPSGTGSGLRASRSPPACHCPCHVQGGCMRTIGLDLAVQTAHKAVVLDECGPFCTPIMTVHTQPSELDPLLARARDGAPS